jgi:hypothetical protein
MTEIESGEMPAADAIAPETELVESSTTPETETPAETGQQTEAERDERGRFTGAQKRFDELTREKYDARREAEYWREMAMRSQPQPEPVKAEPVKLPTLAEYEYDEGKYQAALIQYATQQAEQVVERRLTQAEQQRAEQARLGTFAERQRAFAKATPDFEDKVLRDPSLPISAAMRDVIVDSDSGPEIAYHLANNRAIAERIAALPPHLAALELGRIEGRLTAEREAAKRPTPAVSKAPPPPPTVEAVEPEVDKDPENMAINDWVKWREKQLRKRR